MRKLAWLLLLGLLVPLGGCRTEEMDRFFIVTAMAVDYDGQYVLHLEGSSDVPGQNGEPKAVVRTGRGGNLTQCLLDVQRQTGEYPYLRQAGLLVLSKAVQGGELEGLIDGLLNENGLRLNARVAVTDGPAGDLFREDSFESHRILKALTKGGGTLTSADIQLLDLVYTRESPGIDPVLPKTDPGTTEGLALLVDGAWVGAVEPRLVPAFMMAGGTERGGSLTVMADGRPMAFRLLENRRSLRVTAEEGGVAVHIGIKASFRASDRLTGDPAGYEALLRQRLEGDLRSLLACLQTAGCDALGIGQQLYRHDPAAWEALAGDWPAAFAACRLTTDVQVEIQSTGRLKAE